jgi:hypothetical protein
MKRLTAEKRRELSETANLFEMIAATNPSDVSALESLIEIYAKPGEAEKLARATARLGVAPADYRWRPGTQAVVRPPIVR